VSALDPLLAIAVAEPCFIGAPLLHRLVDGELSTAETRAAADHAARCPTCGEHLRWLELEEQAVREVAAPSPQRFVALWSQRLRQRLVAAIADEAGAELPRAAARARALPHERPASTWSRALGYLRQLAGWLGRADLERRCKADGAAEGAAILAGFAELLGEEWPPLLRVRRLLGSAARRPSARDAKRPDAKRPDAKRPDAKRPDAKRPDAKRNEAAPVSRRRAR
jgi:anti-sigma factor RsiW